MAAGPVRWWLAGPVIPPMWEKPKGLVSKGEVKKSMTVPRFFFDCGYTAANNKTGKLEAAEGTE